MEIFGMAFGVAKDQMASWESFEYRVTTFRLVNGKDLNIDL